MIKKLISFLFLFLSSLTSGAQIVYSDPNQNLDIDKNVFYLEDTKDKYSIQEVASSESFKPISNKVQNFGITSSAVWFKLSIKNKTDIENLILIVNQPIIDQIDFYAYDNKTRTYPSVKLGEYKPFNERTYQTPDYLFDLIIPKDSVATFFLKVKCNENMQVPLLVGTRISSLNRSVNANLASGLYFGIMIVMLLYNLFIYLTLRDRSYILYSIYILLTLLTQTSLQGYTFQILWPNTPWMAIYSPFLFPALVGIVGLEFFKHFLKIKERLPLVYKISFFFLIPYTISIVLSFFGQFKLSFTIMEATASAVSIFMLGMAVIVYRMGVSEARYLLFGWSAFLLGVCIYVLKDFEILPYNGFTRYTMHFGSAAEVILLSFALADRINILKKEKEISQANALDISRQNELLITEQNIMLEQKVHERTLELEETNEELNHTLNRLTDAQIQLVDAEKMASLGQLTAGIAHEINNPINFVLANIKPLRMDIEEVIELVDKYQVIEPSETSADQHKEIKAFIKKIDLEYIKSEMESMLNGIQDGAKRTAEIVSGLKNFSRLDEYDIKEANINDGIESTLILLRSSIPENIEVVKQLEVLPMIECYPGKLNQVFMNVFSNAIYALNKKNTADKKQLHISTLDKGNQVWVLVEDTGIGMTKESKDKIFEPFYTTKDVGEGTGLGMSIVFKIIESHQAKIEIESEPGVGTKVTLILNKKLMK